MTERGQKIREARRRRGLTQAALGERVGVGRDTIKMIEIGRREPSPDLVRRLATKLGLSESELVPTEALARIGSRLKRLALELSRRSRRSGRRRPLHEEILAQIRAAQALLPTSRRLD